MIGESDWFFVSDSSKDTPVTTLGEILETRDDSQFVSKDRLRDFFRKAFGAKFEKVRIVTLCDIHGNEVMLCEAPPNLEYRTEVSIILAALLASKGGPCDY